ncbi:hypothetical protein AGRA3207_003898 [Actinomadura graeca]|uniref:Uncharacterized protein n=1 Tax=Actinomadura graeca TaxID=2750812 RepID=A0ABX8QVP0_9ACTN|nr:hypothetical protein [Actinomadura graeca]QXJ22835.1 hypothetical protein AGRA3207_003898 [Actinomadura graeca]
MGRGCLNTAAREVADHVEARVGASGDDQPPGVGGEAAVRVPRGALCEQGRDEPLRGSG